MIVGGAWEWNENRRLARRRNFRDGARAGTAQNQIGPREESWHVSNERINFGRGAGLLVGSQHVTIAALSRLMDDVDVRHLLHQLGQTLNHGLVDGVRTLAPAEHQQGSPVAQRWFVRNFKKCLANRYASDYRMG